MNTKKFIQILAVSATALITACEERLTSNDYATPITVTSQVSEKTRAGYEGTTSLPSTFVMDIDQQSENYNYSLVTMTRDDNTATYNAPADMLLLWKGSDHSGANIKAMTIPDGLTAIDPINPMTISVRTDQTTDANVKASDLLGAKTDDGITINGDAINIEFRHLLSKLNVNYEFADGLRNPRVNSIILKNTCIQGGYSYKDMNYDNSSLDYGDITMFHNSNSKAAEAIFYPHTPTSELALEVSITINYRTKKLTCPIELKSGKSFEGGKLYTMNIRINGTSINNAYITTVKDWISDSGSMTNKKILWIGTSIPTGEAVNNYPKMIADATGYNIVNNSRAASYVCFIPWSTWLSGSISLPEAYCLSATRDEIDAKYRPIANQLLNNNQTEVERYLNDFKGYSYESLIIPYINGEKDNCNVIVIDHGFNDRAYVLQEAALGERPIDQGGMRDGILWLNSLINGNEYVLDPWYKEFMAMGLQQDDRESYIAAMNYVIKKCKEANSNVQIIIGNYFATSSPYFVTSNGFHFAGEYIVKANEAIAKMNNLEIVNVYQYTGLDDENSHELYSTLIPDGIHPHTDPIGRLNRIIANIYLEEFRRIFGE